MHVGWRPSIACSRENPDRADQLVRALLDLTHDGDQDAACLLLDVTATIANRRNHRGIRFVPADVHKRNPSAERIDDFYGDLALTIADCHDHHRLDRLVERLVSRALVRYRRRIGARADAGTVMERHTVSASNLLDTLPQAHVDSPEETVTTRVALGQWREAVERAIANGTIDARVRDEFFEHRLRPALTGERRIPPSTLKLAGRRRIQHAPRTLADITRTELIAQ